jgi:virulence factor BrkB
MPIATLWHVTLRAVQDWWQDNCLRLAASLAYYTALSLAPLVLLIVGVIGLVLDRQQVGSQLSAQLEGLIGPAGRELVTSILSATTPPHLAKITRLFRAFGEARLAPCFILNYQRLRHGRALVSWAGSSFPESPRPPASRAAARARPRHGHSSGA